MKLSKTFRYFAIGPSTQSSNVLLFKLLLLNLYFWNWSHNNNRFYCINTTFPYNENPLWKDQVLVYHVSYVLCSRF